MSGKDLINGIKADSAAVWRHLFSSPARAMKQQLGPLMKDVRDITFDDVFEEACIILMENVKAGKLDEGETNLEGYLYVLCKRIALRYASTPARWRSGKPPRGRSRERRKRKWTTRRASRHSWTGS